MQKEIVQIFGGSVSSAVFPTTKGVSTFPVFTLNLNESVPYEASGYRPL